MSDAPYTLEEALGLVAVYDGREGTPADYPKRYAWLMRAAGLAAERRIPVGFRLDPAEPEWPVIYFELPTGQCSWHLPQHPNAWDGHSTEVKYERVKRFVEGTDETDHSSPRSPDGA